MTLIDMLRDEALMNYQDGISRVYFSRDDKLYEIEWAGEIIAKTENLESGEVYFANHEDINLLLNINASQTLIVDSVENVNIDGKVVDSGFTNRMETDVVPVFSGVDKTGETTTYTLMGKLTSDVVKVIVKSDLEGAVKSEIGLDAVSYYDLNDTRNELLAFPIKDIFSKLGITYSITYREDWDIYVINFL